MNRLRSTRRAVWLLTGLALVATIVIGTMAVGLAFTPTSNDIVLLMDSQTSEFQYGDIVQEVSAAADECDATPDSTDGPIMVVSGAVYTKGGSFISDETVGYHRHSNHRGLGVNSDADTSCGLINSLRGNTTEALTLSLGTAPVGQLIESVTLDFETRSGTTMRIDYLDGDTVLFTESYDLPADASDTNPGPGGNAAMRLDGPQDPGNIGTLFDGVRISMDNGKAALSGGASWDDPAANRTVFHLAEATPEISIDSTTNGTDGDSILVGEPITWSNLVTNTGPVALTRIEVIDSELGTIPCLTSDLMPGESTTCSIDGTAEAGAFANEATVTGTTPGGVEATATDTSSYFGLLGCGDSDLNGGPGFEDDPLAAFVNGPTKGDAECGAAVDISTSTVVTTEVEQTVDVVAPPGFTWDGVTGIVTVEWDAEVPTNNGVGRTVQQLIPGDPLSEVVIPWCGEVVGIALSGGNWFYELDPVTTYPTATGSGDTCLVQQTTTTVDVGGVIHTQTTEVFYIWNDPRLVRRSISL